MTKATRGAGELDPFTREVIRNGLVAAAEEMFYSLGRTAKSPIIYEVLDYACGITDAHGRLIAQANGVPGFLGTLTYQVQEVLQKFGADTLNPGDVFIANVPYSGGGTHLSDVSLVQPIFYKRALIGFSVNKGHWTEVGGKDPGSWTTDSIEIYQEGTMLPCIRLFTKGVEIPSVVDLIRANSRLPDETIGDMRAQAASLTVAANRVVRLCDKYGVGVVLRAIEEILAWGKRITLSQLEKLPRGTYEAEEYLDTYGIQEKPVKVKAKVTIGEKEIAFDFSGTEGQIRGPVNCPRSAALSALRTMMMAITDPHIHANEGCFEPMKINIPDGTVISATKPFPTSTFWEGMSYAQDVIWNAMAPLVPEKLTAGHFLSVCATIVGGVSDETGGTWLIVEPEAGGWGAGANKDGESGLVCSGDGETYIMPVEIQETRYPILVEQFSLNTADGGYGKNRGGFGLIRDYKIMNSNGFVTSIFGRSRFPPWGMAGGYVGTGNFIEVIPKDGKRFRTDRVARHPLKRDDVVRLITGVGGGYGKPFERDPERVLDDVRNECITISQAKEKYGVVIDPSTLSVDKNATSKLRKQA